MSKNIFKEDGKYYFYGECEVDRYGPYDTAEIAEEKLKGYADWLNYQDAKDELEVLN